MDGERDGGEREGEVWRPRFSSRDVNNDRNDRIRPRPLVFRVTSGRVTADNAIRGSSRGASQIEEGILLLLLLPFSPLSTALYSTAPPPPPPPPAPRFVGSSSVRRLCAIRARRVRVFTARPGFTQTYDAQQSDRGKSCPSVPPVCNFASLFAASSPRLARSLARSFASSPLLPSRRGERTDG